MKYLCLVYHEETKVDALSESEYDAIVSEVLDYREELRKSGHYIYLIEATDLNDAIRVTSKMPPVRLGCIEVRPLKELTRRSSDTRTD